MVLSLSLRENQYRLRRIAAMLLSVIAVVLFVVLFFIEKSTVVKVTEVAQDELVTSTHEKYEEVIDGELLIVQKGNETDIIRIPLDGTIGSSDITAENHYLNKQIKVVINKASDTFGDELVVNGNKQQVGEAYYHRLEDAFQIEFTMDKVYEISTQYEKNGLTIVLEKPKAKYDKIVVLSPGKLYGDITWSIASKVKEALDIEGIKVYFSRTEDTDNVVDDVDTLASTIYADMLIGIEIGDSEVAEDFGTKVLYNGQYFIPTISNVLLADLLEHQVAISVSGKAIGIEDERESGIVANATVPAAIVIPGYISNAEESRLLTQAQYQQRIADGIYNAIMQAYERIEKQ